MNEVSNHFLQIFVNHNIRHKGLLPSEVLQEMSQREEGDNKRNSSALEQSESLHETVLAAMKKLNDKFVPKKDIQLIVQKSMDGDLFEKVFKQMIDDGKIFGIDDDKFAITD